jgi:MFS family permease
MPAPLSVHRAHTVPTIKKSRVLAALAELAASASPSRAGTASPGAAPALTGAPALTASEAHPLPRSRLRRSLRACTAEGILAEVVSASTGGALVTAWALHLGAGALMAGLLVVLPQIAQLFHVPAAWSTARLGHRRAAIWLVGASRQMFWPLVVLPFLPLGEEARRGVLVAVLALAGVLAVLGNNAWVVWMSELVPRRLRGRYFGRRTMWCLLGAASASSAAGLLLDRARAHGSADQVLAGLALLACVTGWGTVLLMRRQHDPAGAVEPAPINLQAIMRPLRDGRVRPLLVYQAVWNLAVGVAGSFFGLFMLRHLAIGFALLALHGTVTSLSRMLAAPLWGRLIDRMGVRRVLVFCCFGIAAVPLIWLLPTPSRLWPLAVDAVLAGALWSGHGIASFTLPFELTPREGRPAYLAVLATVGGLAFSAGTLLGGTLAETLPDPTSLFGLPIADLQALFVASAVLRFLGARAALRIHRSLPLPHGS